MSDPAKITWEGDSKSVEAAYNRMVRENAKLREQIRGLKTDSQQVADAWAQGLAKITAAQDKWAMGMRRLADQQRKLDVQHNTAAWQRLGQVGTHATDSITSNLHGVVAQLFAVETAVDLVKGAYAEWEARMEAMGQKHKQFSEGLVAEITRAGMAARGGDVEAFVGGSGAGTREQRAAAFFGVQESIPLASFDRQKALAEQVTRAAATGRDMRGFGGLVGSLGDLLPGEKAGDVADIAVMLQARAGSNLEKLGGDKFLKSMKALQVAGVGGDDILGMGLAAADANVSPEVLHKVATAIAGTQEQIKTSRSKRRLTADDKLFNEFAGKSDAEQLQMLFSRPDIARAVLKDSAFEFGRLSPDLIRGGARAIAEAKSGNAFDAELAGLSSFAAGREALAEQQAQEEISRADAQLGPAQAGLNRIRERLRSGAAAQNPFQQTRAEAAIRLEQGLSFAQFDPTNGLAKAVSLLADLFGTQEQRLQKFGEDTGILTKAIEANTQAVQQANGQRTAINVNRHTE